MAAIPGQRYAGKHDNLPAKPSSEELVPACVADVPEKLALWRFLVADLRDRNLWSPTYTVTLTEMVNCATRLAEVSEILDKEGVMVPRYSGKGVQIGEMKHPLLSEEGIMRDKLMKFVEKFGLSPRDIVFLTQTDAVENGQVEVVSTDKPKIVYWRD